MTLGKAKMTMNPQKQYEKFTWDEEKTTQRKQNGTAWNGMQIKKHHLITRVGVET